MLYAISQEGIPQGFSTTLVCGLAWFTLITLASLNEKVSIDGFKWDV